MFAIEREINGLATQERLRVRQERIRAWTLGSIVNPRKVRSKKMAPIGAIRLIPTALNIDRCPRSGGD
jgi:hypothetical protein